MKIDIIEEFLVGERRNSVFYSKEGLFYRQKGSMKAPYCPEVSFTKYNEDYMFDQIILPEEDMDNINKLDSLENKLIYAKRSIEDNNLYYK